MARVPALLTCDLVQLRRSHPTFESSLFLAVEASLNELRMWMPWAQVMTTRDELTLFLEHGVNDFDIDAR
ncbi:MAG: hypothetical protein ACYC1I_00260 [Acidimicrobiales bacterium]